MNKFKKVLMFVLMIALFPLVLVACNDKNELKSIALKENTLNKELIINEALDTSRVVIIASYEDGSTKEVVAEDLTFTSIDSSKIGYQNLTITYLEKNITITIKVVSSITDTYNIVGFEKPAFVVAYENNIATKDNKEEEFFKRTEGYSVGDDNPFVFLPKITALDDDLDDVVLNKYLSLSKVELVTETGSTELTGDALTEMVVIDNENSSFNFTEQSIGSKFKISVRPLYLTEMQEANVTNWTQSFTFTVQDGWNVYDVANLSRWDNNAGTKTAWADLKTANNIGTEQVNSLILHNDFNITVSDIPSEYIYRTKDTADTKLLGKLKNWKSIYTRDVKENETFNMIGNYFTVDASKVPLVGIEGSGEGFDSHSMLFAIGGDNDGCPSGIMGGSTIKNINMIGNTKRSESAELAGGLNMLITNSKNQLVDNVIFRSFFTNFIIIYETTDVLIENSKGYDSYSCMFYGFGAPKTTLKNSEFKGSGGPLIILTHISPEKNPNTRFSNIDIIDCELEALVTGTEAWFSLHGATEIAAGIKALNEMFLRTSTAFKTNGIFENAGKGNIKSFVKDGKINFICAIMSSDPLANTTPLSGSININKKEKLVGSLNMQNDTLKGWVNAINGAMGNNAGYLLPYFQTSAGGFSTVTVDADLNPTGLGKLTEKGLASIDQTDVNMFEGDYLNIFANGGFLGALVEYFNM